jgi:hypothetical protein
MGISRRQWSQILGVGLIVLAVLALLGVSGSVTLLAVLAVIAGILLLMGRL